MQTQIEALSTRAERPQAVALTRANLLAIALILAVGVLHLATIRAGHEWGDDFSLYIHHAKNIVEGRPYEDTGYIYNPFWPGYSPRAYPPVFPLLLAPVYALYGLDLMPMKVEVILFFIAALVVVYLTFGRYLSTAATLALLALIGLNPYIWDFKDSINSEMPFIFFLYLSLYLIDQAYRAADGTRVPSGYTAAVGLAIYLAYGTRTLGILLLPCLLLYDLLRFRRLSPFALRVAGLVLACAAVQRLFVQGDSSYLDQLGGDLSVVAGNFSEYRLAFTMFWYEGYPRIVRTPLFVLLALLALFGYVMRLRRGPTVFELLPIPYLAVILVWSFYQGNRFLLPLVPLFVFYVMFGLRSLSAVRLGRLEPALLALLTVMTLGAYITQIPRQEYPALSEGVGTREAAELFEYIRSTTEPDDVIVFQKARALSLYTGRPAASYHVTDDDQELWGFIRSIDAAYVVTSREELFRDREFFNGFIARHQAQLEPVYANAEFSVYRIRE